MSAKTQDLMAGIGIFLLGLLSVAVLIPNGIVEPAKVKFAALSPSYYPRIVACALVLVGALIVGRLLLRKSLLSQPEPLPVLGKPTWARLALVFVLLPVIAWLLEPLGFVLTSAGALLFLLLLGGERRPLMLATIPIVAPTLLFYFFLKVASIPFPNGVLSGVMPGA